MVLAVRKALVLIIYKVYTHVIVRKVAGPPTTGVSLPAGVSLEPPAPASDRDPFSDRHTGAAPTRDRPSSRSRGGVMPPRTREPTSGVMQLVARNGELSAR